MELRRRKLPKPTFPAIKKAYLAIDDPHLCGSPKAIVHAKKGLVVSGVRMGEALAKSIAPLCRYPDEGTEPDPRPGLRAFDYDLFAGASCMHGYPVDAEHLEDFLRGHWGNPELKKGEKSSIEEFRGRVGIILFTSVGSEKKAKGDDQAQVRGKAGIALWESNDTIGPSYWQAERILFWELQMEGGRSKVAVPMPDAPSTSRAAAKETSAAEEDAPDTEKPPPPKKKLVEHGMYCPKAYDRAPQHMVEGIEADDLRNYSTENANEIGKKAYEQAVHGVPGGATSDREQAFWSGSGFKHASAEGSGFTVQEQVGGAKELNEMNERKELQQDPERKLKKDRTFYSKEGEDSGISNERIWKTISMRSAENASGEITAFVAGGQAQDGNIFATVELPTLLHNDKVNAIHFKNPDFPDRPAITWRRNEKGCWVGDAIVPDMNERNKKSDDPKKKVYFPGFELHDERGFVRPEKKLA